MRSSLKVRRQSVMILGAEILWLLFASGCGSSQTHETGAGRSRFPGPLLVHKGLSVTELPDTARVVSGQTIYVPAYSFITISERADHFNLAITLAVRNTDSLHPMIITKVQYLGETGQLVRGYLDKPILVGPLASASFFVAESDSKAGECASFVVEWVGTDVVSPPISECIMVGVGGTQGVSFVCPGRVIADRRVGAGNVRGSQ